jgi:hypothetical protein
MERPALKTKALQVLVSIIVAAIGSALFTFLLMWQSALLFNKLYPHDGQNGLGVLFVGVISVPVGFFGSFCAAMAFQINLKRRSEIQRSRISIH